jgi:hypothetical protein
MILNHSAIKLLACPRRYQLRVLRSLKEPTNASLSIGSAVHGLLEAYQKGPRNLSSLRIDKADGTYEEMAFINAVPAICDKYNVSSVDRGKVYGAALAAIPKLTLPLYHNDKPLVELKLQIPLEDGVILQGTIDDVTMTNQGILITDHKTTSYMTISDIAKRYGYSSQVHFYGGLLERARQQYLPPHVQDLPIFGRYHVIGLNKSPVTTQFTPPTFCNADLANDIVSRAVDMMRDIDAIDKSGSYALPTGMADNACYKCPYVAVCHSKDIDKQVELAEKETYNPMTFR